MDPPHCPVCDEVIGIYEPLAHLGSGIVTHTSRAAEPEICSSGQCFHRECFERLSDAGELA